LQLPISKGVILFDYCACPGASCGLVSVSWGFPLGFPRKSAVILSLGRLEGFTQRKAGAWLAENVNHDGNKFGAEFQDGTPLPDGIDKKESHRWQLEASLPDDVNREDAKNKLTMAGTVCAQTQKRVAWGAARLLSPVITCLTGYTARPL
jgi:hypothetical protein